MTGKAEPHIRVATETCMTTSIPTPTPREKPKSFQEIILRLSAYWSSKG